MSLEARRVAEITTRGGAEALGPDDRIGSLTPGKRADLPLVRKTDINIAPVLDPDFSPVCPGQPTTVHTVSAAGRILVSGVEPFIVDMADIVRAASASALKLHDDLEAMIATG